MRMLKELPCTNRASSYFNELKKQKLANTYNTVYY